MISFEQLEDINRRIAMFERRVAQSVDEFGATELLSIISRLPGLGTQGTAQAKAILSALKKNRSHAHLVFAASEISRLGLIPHEAAKFRIQALIELGQLTSALDEVSVAKSAEGVKVEHLLECLGLEGRIFKQLFVFTKRNGAPDLDLIEASRQAYQQGWELSERTAYWHAINLLALNHIKIATFDCRHDDDEKERLAHRVIELAKTDLANNPDSPWPRASIGEARLALGEYDMALKAFGEYCQKTNDAFALNSTRRQLIELWEIDTSPELELKAIYDEVTADLLKAPGSKVQFSQKELSNMGDRLSSDGYEGLFGGRPVPIGWVQRLIQSSQCVGRVERRGGGELASRFGTGTVFHASEINSDWADLGHVFITNEHVVSAYGRSNLKPKEAVVRFSQSAIQKQTELGRVLWCSHREDHDITIFHIPELPEGVRSMSQTADLSVLGNDGSGAFAPVTVIGHPMGSDLLHLAIENLTVEDLEQNRPEGQPERVWYKCPTMEGNSGSPVLSWKSLEATAVHHREIYARGCNEGISLSSIKDAIMVRPNGWNGEFY